MTIPAFMCALPNHRCGDPAERERHDGFSAPGPLDLFEQETQGDERREHDEVGEKDHAALYQMGEGL